MPLEEITSQSLSPRCMRCMIDKYADACPSHASWQERATYLRRVLRIIADGSTHLTAPEISHELAHIQHEMFGIERDFTAIKRHFNQLVLDLEEELTARIDQSENPMDLAIRCALVGNFIDFGPTGDVSEAKLLQLVKEAETMELDEEALADLKVRMCSARTIAYLLDNCGEVVLDKILMTHILRKNSRAEICAIVRGAPTSNDATMEDAQQVGLDTIVPVIGNGSDVAGTCPTRVNKQTLNALQNSDLVIAKGLANYETLSGRGKNIYFMFLCKCSLYTQIFNVPLYTGMVIRGV